MPAQSPTLSPTLSAITAGLRGSSSGMPASTLPTRSAPTSAPLVKMPPPRRAKMEISDEPKPRPISGWMIWSIVASCAAPLQDCIVARHPQQTHAHHQHAGDGAAAEGDVERFGNALARGFRRTHVGADRHVHADVAGSTRQHGADDEAGCRRYAEGKPQDNGEDDADDGDRPVLSVQIGLGAPDGPIRGMDALRTKWRL
jgi:hypothetical protein